MWNMPMYKTVSRKQGKLPAKLAEETPWNKLCVHLKGLYKTRRKGKEPLILRAATMIEPIIEWSEVTQYSDKKEMPTVDLVETTWLVWYPWPVEITYDKGGEFFGHKFKNSLIEEEYGIKTKPD